MNHRLVTYLEDAALVLALFLVLEAILLVAGWTAASYLLVFACFALLVILRWRRD